RHVATGQTCRGRGRAASAAWLVSRVGTGSTDFVVYVVHDKTFCSVMALTDNASLLLSKQRFSMLNRLEYLDVLDVIREYLQWIAIQNH
ncbi:MAG: hypothetical protein RLY91_503, partial [Pseudomonadota bacterium]